MKAIMVMFDSLKRDYLSCYGCDWTHTPNFDRLAQKTVVFDRNYVGSMPCMPARRELHTGRYGFLHRGWGPLEPFDDSMPELLKEHGVYTHIVTDHQHYWQDGGAGYLTRYSSWEAIRGQEGDNWKADLNPAIRIEHMVAGNEHYRAGLNDGVRFDAINRANAKCEADKPQTRTFDAGLEFLNANWRYDNWFLQIECFDPHEPFDAWPDYQALYPRVDIGRQADWPRYGPCEDAPDVVAHVGYQYAALLSQCDRNIGRVLDFMDAHDLWKDTLLIVNTDHGFLLGEHDWWAKTYMPLYETVSHTPLFIWDPRSGVRGERRESLTQNIDLAPTLLEYFGVDIPPDMLGVPLRSAIQNDQPAHDYVLFGHHACHVYITDGRYVYMRAPMRRDHLPAFEYTLMPARLHPGFRFTKGCPVLAMPGFEPQGRLYSHHRFGNRLYDLLRDPDQTAPLDDPALEVNLMNEMSRLMRLNDAPPEQYERLGLRPDGDMTVEALLAQRAETAKYDALSPLAGATWQYEAKEQYLYLCEKWQIPELEKHVLAYVQANGIARVTCADMEAIAARLVPQEKHFSLMHGLHMVARRL